MKTVDVGIITREKIYAFIIAYKLSNDGNSPSFRQIATACGLRSLSAINHQLNELQNEGKIKMGWGGKTAIVVIGGQWVAPRLAEGSGRV